LAFPISHFANGFHPTDLDDLGFISLIRLSRPLPKGLVAGEVPLYQLAGLGRVDLSGGRRGGHYRESKDQQ
jgi:hypothetical protein